MNMPTPACVLCGSQNANAIFRACNKLFSQTHECTLMRCECGLLFTAPSHGVELSELYASNDYYTHATTRSVKDRARDQLSAFQFLEPFRSVRLWLEANQLAAPFVRRFMIHHFPLTRGKTILDFGCGSGRTVRLLRSIGVDAFGFEPDHIARKCAAANGTDLAGSMKEFEHIRFDGIIMSHVLEHLEDPVAQLAELQSKLLDENSRLLISVPNAQSRQAELFGSAWIGYDMPRHRWHFTPNTLGRLIEKAGLSVQAWCTIERPDFAAASDRHRTMLGQPAVDYATDRKTRTRLEEQNLGSELLAVAAPRSACTSVDNGQCPSPRKPSGA